MTLPDQLSGLFWLGISIFVCIESLVSGIGTFRSPGPGFLPLLSGVILGMFSIILVITSSLKKGGKGKITDLWKGVTWNKVIWVLLSLFIYPLFLPVMGYLITTFGLMTFLLVLMGRSRGWIQGLVTALVMVSVSYVIFHVLLDIRLPTGIFGF